MTKADLKAIGDAKARLCVYFMIKFIHVRAVRATPGRLRIARAEVYPPARTIGHAYKQYRIRGIPTATRTSHDMCHTMDDHIPACAVQKAP